MNTKELKCPKCGNVFSVDEADYAFIANQVRNEEFNADVNRRLEDLHKQYVAEQALKESKLTIEHDKALGKKDDQLREKDEQLKELRQKLQTSDEMKALELAKAVAEAVAEKEKTIAELNSKIEQSSKNQEIAVLEERNKIKDVLAEKENEITRLNGVVEKKESETTAKLAAQKEQFDIEKRSLKAEVELYKDMKARLSTKMVGETLEIHCSTEFNRMRPLFPNAYFEKDNDITKEGNTKGDFIFRDYEDGVEYISIMFEMKNENDETTTKHTNESFLKKLDADRTAKNCEYAVLVSLLEPDSELYNTGIVDMSHRYPKMYVIRPQFFIPMITLLVQASKKSVEYKKQLALVQSQSIDVTNFENKLLDFKKDIGYNYKQAFNKYNEAISGIDKAIETLTKIREAMVGSVNNLRIANNKAEDMTIRKLTYKNKTMKALLDKAREENQGSQEPEDENQLDDGLTDYSVINDLPEGDTPSTDETSEKE